MLLVYVLLVSSIVVHPMSHPNGLVLVLLTQCPRTADRMLLHGRVWLLLGVIVMRAVRLRHVTTMC